MRKFILILVLFAIGFLLAQYTKVYQITDLFRINHAWYDSLQTVPEKGFTALKTTATADTIESDWVDLYGGGGDVFVMMRRDTIAQSTVGVEYWLGIYRLPGFPDSTATEWHKLATITGNGTAKAALTDSTWWNNAPTHRIKFKFVEKGITQNYLLVGFTHFKQGR